MELYFGVVESRKDPLKMGRCKVRVIGVHCPDRVILPTDDLPWAMPMTPITSASMNGIGESPTGVVEGTYVAVFFLDGNDKQKPVMMGTFPGWPMSTPGNVQSVTAGSIVPPASPTTSSDLPSSVAPPPGVNPTAPAPSNPSDCSFSLGSLSGAQVCKLKAEIAKYESGGKPNPYSVENSIGYIGKYQFGVGALIDTGYIKNMPWRGKKLAPITGNPANWTGKDGVTSKQAWFNSPAAQENAMNILLGKEYRYAKLDSGVPPEKTAGVLAACHLVGAGPVNKWLAGGPTKSDKYGTNCSTYYKAGYAAIAGTSTNEIPTRENLHSAAVASTAPPSTPAPATPIIVDPTSSSTPAPSNPPVAVSPNMGFVDPNGKYPQSDFLNEADCNRLARNEKIDQTVVSDKRDGRTTGNVVANGGGAWDQPTVPYASQYPYNHVYQSESGHLLEFDDTAGAERIHLYHKTGTFTEIDCNGTQVNKIVGNGYTIIDSDGYISISGQATVSVTGNCSIFVAADCHLDVQGDINVHAAGTTNLHSEGQISFQCDDSLEIECTDFKLKCDTFNVASTGKTQIKSGSDMNLLGSTISGRSSGIIAFDGTKVINMSGVAKSAAPLVPALQFDSNSPEFILLHTPSAENNANMQIEEMTTDEMIAVGIDPTNPEFAGGTPGDPDTTPTNPPPARIVSCSQLPATLTKSTRLTPNFTIGKLCSGEEARAVGAMILPQHGLTVAQQACNMNALAVNCLEPILAAYPDMKLNSGWRPSGNRYSKTETGKTSQHELGMAADLTFTSIYGKRAELFKRAQEIKNLVPFDQLIYEVRGKSVWIHVSFNPALPTQRKMLITFNGGKTTHGLNQIN